MDRIQHKNRNHSQKGSKILKGSAYAEGSPLSNYYQSIGLSPVEHDITQDPLWEIHERKRRNLLEYNLKLPVRMWNGAEVLEFGPGSGENAALIAKYGVRLTLVEPIGYLIEKLQKKFAQRNVKEAIRAIHQDTIENFEATGKYDIVLAEGFIQFLDNPQAAIRKMTQYVADDGFLLISIVHTAGTFIEFVKKLLLARMINAADALSDEERMLCARDLFLEDFGKINHSRSFESWTKDTVLNPLYRRKNIMDFEEVMQGVSEDFYLYSSWPNYLNKDDLVWHKTIRNNQQLRAECLDGYYARYPHFIHSSPTDQGSLALCRPQDGRTIAKALDACMKQMDEGVDLENTSFSISKMAREFEKLHSLLLKFPQVEKSARIAQECATLFRTVERATSPDEFPKAYRKVKFLKQCWGSPGHYYVFGRRPGL